MLVVLCPQPDGSVSVRDVDRAQAGLPVVAEQTVALDDLAGLVREREAECTPEGTSPDASLRWVWADTSTTYRALLDAGVRVTRCWDLRLCRAILRASALTARTGYAAAPRSTWDETPTAATAAPDRLFDLAPPVTLDPLAELRDQHRALDAAVGLDGRPESARLWLLLAAESAGALNAAEMTVAGVPWDVVEHDRILTDLLGPRPALGYRPALLEAKAAQVSAALGVEVNPDSPVELLRSMRSAGLPATSTRSWELQQIDHPAIAPLLEYKKMSRLMTANGWHWLDTWVSDGRFRPVYVPGGVVTGRWASDGGGALQLPHQIRSAVRSDPGWSLVVADAAQLEPRILAAMSGDAAMAEAGRAADMYEGMVATGAVETRQQAKFGMLGAMYGGTQGESGRMLPRITRAFPRALALVEAAARAGEHGEVVSTWLGRSSPLPSAEWRSAHSAASAEGGSAAEQEAVRTQARSWGRFTRNFVVQGTAAEWALCWMSLLRLRLRALSEGLTDGPHLAFFLHDEIMVHTPTGLADEVATLVQETAHEAGRLLFEGSPVEFRLTTAVVTAYSDAK